MSASHASGSDHGSHEPHPHPPTPAVYDEAADTPTWVPVSGLVLFLVIALYVIFRSAMAPTPPPGASTTDEAYPGEVAPAAPEAPPAQ
ncbi:MAG: hypothetical protein U0234_07770 [Sandaracinus sp.]